MSKEYPTRKLGMPKRRGISTFHKMTMQIGASRSIFGVPCSLFDIKKQKLAQAFPFGLPVFLVKAYGTACACTIKNNLEFLNIRKVIGQTETVRPITRNTRQYKPPKATGNHPCEDWRKYSDRITSRKGGTSSVFANLPDCVRPTET
jgi:hypothetical protein